MSLTAEEFGRATHEYLVSVLPEYDEASMDLGLVLIRAATGFTQASERVVHRPRGLRWTGFSAVFGLAVFQRLEARTMARLAGVSRQAMSLVVSTLERDGLVKRSVGKDRRLRTVELTEEGSSVAVAALAGQVALSEEWFSCLNAQEQRTLLDLLQRVVEQHGRAGHVDGTTTG